MVQLCRPYGEGITCLCDQAKAVLKCFLSSDQQAASSSKNSQSPTPSPRASVCHQESDTKTEIILATAIALLIFSLLTWLFLSRRKPPSCCAHCCQLEKKRDVNSPGGAEPRMFARVCSMENGLSAQALCQSPLRQATQSTTADRQASPVYPSLPPTPATPPGQGW